MQRANRHDREQFVTALLQAVPTATRADVLRLLRWGRTYGRLCEAECNGDWPAANGDGTAWPCPKCESQWRTAYPRRRRGGHEQIIDAALRERACPSCRAERIIRETCAKWGPFGENPGDYHATPHFQSDPRGHTVRLQIAGAPLDAYERPALAVPTS